MYTQVGGPIPHKSVCLWQTSAYTLGLGYVICTSPTHKAAVVQTIHLGLGTSTSILLRFCQSRACDLGPCSVFHHHPRVCMAAVVDNVHGLQYLPKHVLTSLPNLSFCPRSLRYMSTKTAVVHKVHWGFKTARSICLLSKLRVCLKSLFCMSPSIEGKHGRCCKWCKSVSYGMDALH